MKTTFIYFLKDPATPMRGYIGKTSRIKRRLYEHIKECCTEKNYRANWIKSLVSCGLKPTIEIIDEVPFEHWPQLEVAYIEFFLEQGYELTNSTPGGEDPPSWLGNKHTLETRVKLRTGKIGNKNPNFGKKFSPEHCSKISAANSGEKNPNFGKTGKKSSWFGRKHSPETRAKMSIAAKQRGNCNNLIEGEFLPGAETKTIAV